MGMSWKLTTRFNRIIIHHPKGLKAHLIGIIEICKGERESSVDHPDPETLRDTIETICSDYRQNFPTHEDWVATQQKELPEHPWPTRQTLNAPATAEQTHLAEAVGAFTTFVQRYVTDADYRYRGAQTLRSFSTELRAHFLAMLLPLLRRLDYQSALHHLLSDLTGEITLSDATGVTTSVNLLSAHKSAILEFKEEIVAIQLFIAIKRGIEHLFGIGQTIPRGRLAFVSGIAIPCAGDVPAHFVDISPADLDSDRLIHSRAIGSNAIIVVDRQENRAVRVDVKTGILPRDRELTLLRNFVINRKRAATTQQHNRFFNRLGELIVDYVRDGDNNFEFFGPVTLDWREYVQKLHVAPAGAKPFREHLVKQAVTPELARAIGDLGVWAIREDKDLMGRLQERQTHPDKMETLEPEAPTLKGRIDQVVQTVIEPVLNNDGGKLEILESDVNEGRSFFSVLVNISSKG